MRTFVIIQLLRICYVPTFLQTMVGGYSYEKQRYIRMVISLFDETCMNIHPIMFQLLPPWLTLLKHKLGSIAVELAIINIVLLYS